MFSEEDKKVFPRPKPDISLSKKAKTIMNHEVLVAPLKEKRAGRTRQGGSWRLIGGKLVPNEDDHRKGKPVEKEKKPVEDAPPKEESLEDAGE